MLKGLKSQLEKIRDNTAENGSLSHADEALLMQILHDMRPAGNDNTAFTDDQLARLSIIEKTGTGSKYVH